MKRHKERDSTEKKITNKQVGQERVSGKKNNDRQNAAKELYKKKTGVREIREKSKENFLEVQKKKERKALLILRRVGVRVNWSVKCIENGQPNTRSKT